MSLTQKELLQKCNNEGAWTGVVIVPFSEEDTPQNERVPLEEKTREEKTREEKTREEKTSNQEFEDDMNDMYGYDEYDGEEYTKYV